jgi:hypothetical protein
MYSILGVPRRTTQGNDVRTIRVADHTGSINMSVWNDLGEYVTPGDIYRLRNGSTTVYKGQLALAVGKAGEMLKTGEFLLAYSELPDMSAYNAELDAKFPHRKGSPEDEKEETNGNGGNPTSGNGSSSGNHANSSGQASSSGTRPPVKRRQVGASNDMSANRAVDRQRNPAFRV